MQLMMVYLTLAHMFALSLLRFCGGLIKDIKRKAPFFASDFYDALNIQALSAILFIYLATVTNAITFGGLLGDATDNMQVGLI
jgi:sodium bicarbonate cotransporter 4